MLSLKPRCIFCLECIVVGKKTTICMHTSCVLFGLSSNKLYYNFYGPSLHKDLDGSYLLRKEVIQLSPAFRKALVMLHFSDGYKYICFSSENIQIPYTSMSVVI